MYPTGLAVREVAAPFAPMVVLVARVEGRAISPLTWAIAPTPIAMQLNRFPESTFELVPIQILLPPEVIAFPAALPIAVLLELWVIIRA
jgi:hypothetical protein